MSLTDWISIISIVIAVVALVYSVLSNTKKYELTYQYYNDILSWHNRVVEVLTNLRLNMSNSELKANQLSRLSSLIENGRFYFPNIDRKDGFGKDKPMAYQGYRNVILDFLVYEYQILEKSDCEKYLKHTDALQRLFTSYVFQYLEPKKHYKKIKRNTDISQKTQFTINEFLQKCPNSIFDLYSINSNDMNWENRPTQR